MARTAATVIDGNHRGLLVDDGIIGNGSYKNKIAAEISSVIRLCVRRSKMKQHSLFYEDQDFVQEIWVRLLSDGGRILRQYNAARGASFERYLSMIAKREIGNLLRKERADKRSAYLTVELEGNPKAEQLSCTVDLDIESRDLMKKLNRRLCNVLSCHGVDILNAAFRDELDAAETAKNLGVSVQSVYNWQHKIRTLSRSFLSELDGPCEAAFLHSLKDES